MKASAHAGLRAVLRAGYGGYAFPEPMQDFGISVMNGVKLFFGVTLSSQKSIESAFSEDG